jgi:prephenate dehydrogenase
MRIRHNLQPKQSLGLIGFGAFAQLMAEHLGPHFELTACDPAPQARAAMARHGVRAAPLETVAGCAVVVLAAPVAAVPGLVREIAPHLRPGALVLDVGSVKLGPARALVAGLPPHVSIVATHPLFGPQSARDGLRGLKIVLCPLRDARAAPVAAFLRRALGLQVIVTTPEAHDRELALVQGLTHLVAQALSGIAPDTRPRMTTRSFDLLMQAVAMVRDDAPEVFDAIERENPYAAPLRARFLRRAAELAGDEPDPAPYALWAQSQ